jgi:hypothetical protein
VGELIGMCSRMGTSRMTATEGPAKALEFPDCEKLKGLEGPELERSAMVGGSEAAAAPKGGGTARVWGSRRRQRQGGAAARLG